ncbi:MAG: hypothetical protein Q7J57_11790 [Gemmobacter sp.]|nr:hypothetical protein [Gemmobacter sp.]
MSDRMSNVEIEDVLSSIRRLVSDDLRPAAAQDIAKETPPPRLVLTPALRVLPDEVPGKPAPMVADAEPDSLEARIAELEQLLAVRSGDFEPDEGDSFADAVPIGWPPRDLGMTHPDVIVFGRSEPEQVSHSVDTEDAPAEMTVEDQHELSPPDPETPEAGLFAEGGDLIDEDMLRDLVREILREELQGSLGERITRNVRKLVRAEISRALAARDFS